ncbi:cell division protein FtsK [Lewinellaceae bacterium SD302]|nr:cell division protein FtsK [Lewinellaceae bacterium SD302]
MAKRKKTAAGQRSLNIGLNDERLPKLFGILFVFIAAYLFIAFTSYLFTWRIDQDRVLRFSWTLLEYSDLTVENWLGRLGAFFSSFFIYFCFGVPSYLLSYFLYRLGMNRLRRQPLRPMGRLFSRIMLLTIGLSILFEFTLGSMEFPIGGGVGEYLTGYLQRIIGGPGIILLLLVLFALYLVFVARIDFNGNPREIQAAVRDHFSGKFNPKRQPRASAASPTTATGKAAAALPPLEGTVDLTASEENTVLKPRSAAERLKDLQNFRNPGGLSLEMEEPLIQPKGDQLSMPLEDVNLADRPNIPIDPLNVGDDGLEINDPDESDGLTPDLAMTQENQNHSEPYDPTADLPSYDKPVIPLLESYEAEKVEVDRAELEANKDQIIETLLNFKIEITKIRATIGPTVTLFEIVPAPGVRISKIKNLEDDIALSLSALGIRIIAPIPGRGTIGIEVPNKNPQIVSMREVLESEKFRTAKMDLPLALGKTIKNEVLIADLAKMPHLLVAGATGQGKSVGINSIIMSLLYKKHPSQVKLVLIDPKKVELFPYAKLEHHFLAFLPNQTEPITTETAKVIHILNSLCIEMDQRYDLLKKAAARNIKEYNQKFISRRLNPNKGHKFLPFIVLVIDEFADLIMTAGKEVEMPIARLAQLARAVGIHLIIATQRPSVNIITGVIKANFPARVAYKVTAKVDSRTILDAGGADQLIGRGDMLLSNGGDIVRIQGAFVDTPEVEKVIDYIGSQRGYIEPYLLPEYNTDEDISGAASLTYADLDDMFEQAAHLIVSQQHGSTSMIQRRLKLGYNRAGRIMDELEQLGIVGPANGSKPREVLIYDEIELQRYINDIKKAGQEQ